MRKEYRGIAGLLLVAFLLAAGLVTWANWAYPPPRPEQSWDQENLKRNDSGCPTAIFVAPKGELVQC